MANVARMSKAQLIKHGQKLGLKLDDGMVKKTMIALIKDNANAPAKATPKPAKKKATPVKTKKSVVIGKPMPKPKAKTVSPKDKSIWQTVKDFFGV